jgi:hypothetical protein
MVSQDTTDTTDEIVKATDGFTEEALADINSFADVLKHTGNVVNISDVLGNGFSVVDDKTALIGVEFVVVKYAEHKSETTGGLFATMHVITSKNEKLIVNDGSTGICAQLRELAEKQGTVCPLYVPRGLRVSNFTYKDEKTGAEKKAATFYLNTGK